MQKKKQKPYEQKVAEEYFPVDKSDLNYSIEKKQGSSAKIFESREIAVKTPEYEKIDPRPSKIAGVEKKYKKSSEKNSRRVGKRKVRKISKTSKLKNSTEKVKEFHPASLKLKEGGYELIITEKPQAAEKIASSLGKSSHQNLNRIPYYEVDRDGNKIVVACAVGHLFTLKQDSNGAEFPVFDIKWVPNYLARKSDFTKKYYDVLLKLAKNAGSITVATDFDIEGEVIGLNVVRFICGQKDANRMKFSTLTAKELNESYEKKSLHLEWGHAIAGETRHYLDWFYGINLSRALMSAVKSTGRFKIMSIGRVQGPALNLIVKKEREIQEFKPKTYWQVFVTVKNSHEIELKHNKDIFKKSELSKFENLVGKKAEAGTTKTEQIIPPNPPFNLTTLQTEAYKFYGITPSRALQIAQSLYLAGLISYPRTSSQKLLDSIDYKSIKGKLAREYHVEKLVVKEKPLEGKKTDPAHPSIYPTGETQILSGEEEKIYNLIVRRFLSLFCEDAIIDNKKIFINIDGLEFSRRGSSIRKKAWMEIYPVKLKEEEIPDLSGQVKIISLRTEEKETQPPHRYSPASIVSELEKRNLGTKSTRASILETLYDRGYIKEKSIEATQLGMSLISTLEKYSPVIIDEELTRTLEKEMEFIQNMKKDFEKKSSQIIEKAKEAIIKISKDFGKNEKSIGEELVSAEDESREKANKLTQCPKCKVGNLSITYSKKNKRYFVACDKYPECTNTYSLPPNGFIKKTDKTCEACGFPTLMRISKGRRPWEFCFNSACPTNIERIEEYRKKQENQK